MDVVRRHSCHEPAFLVDLMHISSKLEAHFKDVCDIEFCVQHGRVYILACRTAKRTARAAIQIATDLLLEGVITGVELLERIGPEALQEVLSPIVTLRSQNKLVATGVPASAGAATGTLILNPDRARRRGAEEGPYIYAVSEASPEDADVISESAGLISCFGGMTSHGAVMCRSMGRPCVAGAEVMIGTTRKTLCARGHVFPEGSDITISGTEGRIYSGRADIRRPNAHDDKRLCLLLRIIDVLALEGIIPQDRVGHAWRMRDILIHSLAIDSADQGVRRPAKRCQTSRYTPVTFRRLQKEAVTRLRGEMKHWRCTSDYRLIWEGLRTSLFRWLARHVGVGRHFECYRPLFDPEQTILSVHQSPGSIGEEPELQTIGEEFFDINHCVPHCPEIGSIRIYATVACSQDDVRWSIDRTNPRGEKLNEGSKDLVALKVVVNDASVAFDDLPSFYNYLRKKEYFWGWYRGHGVTRQEMIRFLATRHAPDSARVRLATACREAGLLSSTGEVTATGRSLLDKTPVTHRKNVNIPPGE